MRAFVIAFLISFSAGIALAQNNGAIQNPPVGGGGSGSFTPATTNIALSVNSGTGNDNTCTPGGTACATLQKALSIASSFNYLNKFTLAITFTPGASCGTYTATA